MFFSLKLDLRPFFYGKLQFCDEQLDTIISKVRRIWIVDLILEYTMQGYMNGFSHFTFNLLA